MVEIYDLKYVLLVLAIKASNSSRAEVYLDLLLFLSFTNISIFVLLSSNFFVKDFAFFSSQKTK